ncbi:MAG: hypothetical protein K0S09_1995 [Sphingobacteriaceae bacterium]|jgi:F0F1-type ATP synthase assembly protein I|nr:hypothetical protein [Sphingobacteriaceae bacterium]
MHEDDNKPEDRFSKQKKPLDSYIRYSGVGFQMIAIIGICTFIGYKIDQYRGSEQLIFSAVFGLIGVCVSLYVVIKSLNNNEP